MRRVALPQARGGRGIGVSRRSRARRIDRRIMVGPESGLG
jgi:hypothetical protein